jgi:hypothetical protein
MSAKQGRAVLLAAIQDILGFIAQNAEQAGEAELVAKIKPLGQALAYVFAEADAGEDARKKVTEATRWAELWAAGKGKESKAVAQVLGILKGATDAPR